MEPRKRLGRGLDALLGGFSDAPPAAPHQAGQGGPDAANGGPADLAGGAGRLTVPVAALRPNPRNPRRSFRPDDLDELARSLKQHGLVQPIVVRPAPRTGGLESYEIVAGERRWRAAQLAGLHDVPVTVVDISDRQALELAIVENVQRADLNPVEEARGYQALIDEFAYTQADLGDAIGKSRVHVTNTLRLLRLPEPVLAMLEAGTLSSGHGRAVLGAADPLALARVAAERSLSVRETERLAQGAAATPPRAAKAAPEKSADIKALEKELTDAMGMWVSVTHDGEGRGDVTIRYKGLEQLDGICWKLRG